MVFGILAEMWEMGSSKAVFGRMYRMAYWSFHAFMAGGYYSGYRRSFSLVVCDMI